MGILQVPKRLGLKLEPNIARIANALKCFKKVTKVFAKFWGKIVRLSSEIVFNVNCQKKQKWLSIQLFCGVSSEKIETVLSWKSSERRNNLYICHLPRVIIPL